MKKIKYLVFSLIILFGFGMGVLGLQCDYSDGKMNASFKINENSTPAKIGKVQLKGGMGDNTKDESHKEGIDEEEKVINWKKTYQEIDFKGLDYYTNNKTCPPYAILIDVNGFNLVVSDEVHLNEYKKAKSSEKSNDGHVVMKLEDVKGDTPDENQYKGNSCKDYIDDSACEENPYYSCLWVDQEKYPFLEKGYCNTDNLLYVACGDAFDIPYQVPQLISFLVNLLKIATPIILIFVSVITLVKALAASKEDEIKKAQSSLIKKIIAAVMVFFVISIVQFVIMKVADSSETKGLDKCLTCFLNNDCGKSAYYKTNVAGTYKCTYVDGSGQFDCKGGNASNNKGQTQEGGSTTHESSSGQTHGGGGGSFEGGPTTHESSSGQTHGGGGGNF